MSDEYILVKKEELQSLGKTILALKIQNMQKEKNMEKICCEKHNFKFYSWAYPNGCPFCVIEKWDDDEIKEADDENRD